MIQVEPFSSIYTEGVAALILPIQQEEFGIQVTYEQQPDLHDIGGFYQREKGNFWIARDGTKVIGSIALLDIGNDQAALRKMFVVADYRGREKGVAQGLLDKLFDHARSCNLKEIYLGTTDKFLAAHRFYEKNGFSRVEPTDLPATFPRMAVDTIFFWREIS